MQRDAETVTVVIPTYGRQRQLQLAVGSALDDPAVTEVIVVDDASPGGPPDDSDFRDPRARLIVREQNGGVSAAQNSGLRGASGQFVSFLHSDDAWIPGRLERQLATLADAGPESAGVESATIRLKDAGPTTVPARLSEWSAIDLRARRVKNLHISGWLFRRHCLMSIGGFDENLRCYEDLDLLIRLTDDHRLAVEHGAPVTRIDERGEDRLGASDWMADGRLSMVRKHAPALASAGPLPDGWRDWCTQAAVSLLQSGERSDRKEARQVLAMARSGSRRRALSTAPLRLGARLPSTIGRRVARWSVRGSPEN